MSERQVTINEIKLYNKVNTKYNERMHYDEGSLKSPDFQLCLDANRVKWLIKLFQSNKENLISYIPSLYFTSFGGLKHIRNNFDMRRIPENIPAFYKSIFIAWSKFSNEICDSPNAVYNQHLGNNKYIVSSV